MVVTLRNAGVLLVALTLSPFANAFVSLSMSSTLPSVVKTTSGLIDTARAFYSSWNRKDIDTAISFFDDGIIFEDMQYPKPFRGKREVKAYLQECAESLPGWEFVIDDYAEDAARNKVSLKWHVEDTSGIPLPFPTIGLSFLTFNDEGLIKECMDMIEPTVKLGTFQLPLLRAVTKVLGIK